MRNGLSEPVLTFTLSDEGAFRCSACQRIIASNRNGNFVMARAVDLISSFEKHVRRYHSKRGAAAVILGKEKNLKAA